MGLVYQYNSKPLIALAVLLYKGQTQNAVQHYMLDSLLYAL